MLDQEIQDIGLSDKEAKVYLAALELGQASAQEIAKKSQVNRATTYVAIESLINLGLMSSLHEGKKQLFSAASPNRLLELIEIEKANIKSKKTKLDQLMPQLQSIYNKKQNKPVVRYYEGKEGLNTLNKEFIELAEGDIKMAYSLDNVKKLFSEEERNKMRNLRINANVRTQVIYSSEDKNLSSDKTGTRFRVDHKKYPLLADIAVYDDKIRLANLTNKIGGVIIEDKDIATTLESILNLAIEAAKKKTP